MQQLSVIIITLNEERNLGRCLASVARIADEVVIVDSFSTDGTLALAQKFGARVVQVAFAGYGESKNYATSLATHDWILSLDADEELSAELEASIMKFKEKPDYTVYQFARLTNYCGQWIKHCGWYPDKQTRLYDRRTGKWEEKKVHEYWKSTKNERKGLLKGDLLHYSFADLDSHLKKIAKYTDLAADEAVGKGKKPSLLKLITSPGWHFFTEYILRLGFLDGYYGLVICKLSAYAAFIKIAKTRDRNRRSDKK